jgi:copper chaperone CopZ
MPGNFAPIKSDTMTHTYSISGMTCNGCVAGVKSALLKVPGVQSADVQLEPQQAVIAMDKHISADAFQQAIGANSKYRISESAMQHTSIDSIAAGKDSYYPIFLIFGYISVVSLLVQAVSQQPGFFGWMTDFMAGFFLVFSFFKLLNIRGFVDGYSTYDIIAGKVKVYGYVYPFIELFLGLAFLLHVQPLVTNVTTLVVMGVSSIGVIRSLLRRQTIQCACLGTIIKLPLSKVTLFEDLLMVAMSLAMTVHLFM